MTNFTTGQISKLVEIEKARVKNGGQGLHTEVQSLINRLTSGGVGIKFGWDLRTAQAKVLWDRGYGKELGYETFQDYLVTIPEIPQWSSEGDGLFDRVILIEGRVVSITKQCELLGVNFSGSDKTFKPHDPEKFKNSAYWMHCQDGRRNLDKEPMECRTNFVPCEVGSSAVEGLAIFAQNPEIIEDHCMDLPGSVHGVPSYYVACLKMLSSEPRLTWHRGDIADPHCGSVSRQDC